jgi:hypothetical protein
VVLGAIFTDDEINLRTGVFATDTFSIYIAATLRSAGFQITNKDYMCFRASIMNKKSDG